uniref:Chromosome 1 open reading frame 105 n=1 Tax=Aotus nancymaae TaxID=37293 RepID=A0A2K5ELP3_AOTNA
MEEMRLAGHGVPSVCITFEVAYHSYRNGAALGLGQASTDGKSEAKRNQSDSMLLLRNQQLCSTCREMKMVQPRTMKILDDPKVSFENFMSHRMMSLCQPKVQTTPEPFHDDIPTESIHYRLPILGPRTAVFHGLLSEAHKTLKEPMGQTTRQ